MRKVIIYTFLAAFLALGCGDEEESQSEIHLSDQIIGSWQSQEEVPTVTEGNMIVENAGWTLTFYRDGRFDSIFELDARFAVELFTSIEFSKPINVKLITTGKYEAFEKSIVFRPEDSSLYCDDALFQPYLDFYMGSRVDEVNNKMTGTSRASVAGNILLLDDGTWSRI